MTAIEAITYCLGWVSTVPEDGEFRSQVVYDINGEPHWISWRVAQGDQATPHFCSGSPTPFTKDLEPYGLTEW